MIRVLARFAGLVLPLAVVCATPETMLGQETGSDVQLISGSEVVSAVSFALVAGPAAAAATPQAFAVAIQATITLVLVTPGGEAEARAQLGDFRTSILMKAGVLTFDAERAEDSPQPGTGAPTPSCSDKCPQTSGGSGGH